MAIRIQLGPQLVALPSEADAGRLQALFRQALALHNQGQLEPARRIYREVLAQQPRHFDSLHMLGVLSAQMQDPAESIRLIDQAIAVNPQVASAYANRGNALSQLHQYRAALQSYDMAIARRPGYANAYANRGRALLALGRFDEALASFDTALATLTDRADLWCDRGVVLGKLGQSRAALASHDRALQLNPNLVEAHYNRAVLLYETGQLTPALESYDRALTLQPGMALAHGGRGDALAGLEQIEAAISSYDRALALARDLEFVPGLRLYQKRRAAIWSCAAREIEELCQAVARGARASTPFSFLALRDAPDLQRQVAQTWIEAKYPANPELGAIVRRPPRQKIRVAYFSMDFRNHPVAMLSVGLFESHDRRRFEVFGFSYGPHSTDALRTRLEAAFDQFIDVGDHSDREIAALARHLQVDIAIDLAGLTGNARTGIFAFRAAPIQVNYLGYPGTMGASYIDYIVADSVLIAASARQHYAEKIVYLPWFQVNDRRRVIAEREFSRAELGLPSRGFVFCCFNNTYKITPETFACWINILKRVPDSVLWLYAQDTLVANNLINEAVRQGVEARRLTFAKGLATADHLARYRCADLFLDTLPFNAGTTASDALWAGLPVLTCAGNSFASRMAASLLTAIDLPELLTNSPEAYEELAVALALDPQRLPAIRKKLADQRLTSRLFDTPGFTRNLEHGLAQMLERYHKGLAPDHIVVPPPVGEPTSISCKEPDS